MSVRRVVQIAASGPWSRRRQQSSPVEQQDEARRPLLKLSSPLSANLPLYGSTDRLTSSPGAYRRESFLGQVPEEDQVTGDSQDGEENEEITADEVEFALEEQGLYGGGYSSPIVLSLPYSFSRFISQKSDVIHFHSTQFIISVRYIRPASNYARTSRRFEASATGPLLSVPNT